MRRLGKDKLADIFGDKVLISKDPAKLFSVGNTPPSVLIWDQAFGDPAISRLLEQTNWPLQVLAALPQENGWKWRIRDKDYTGDHNASDIERRIYNAAGIASAASLNTHIVLEVRDYYDLTSDVGGVLWWKDHQPSINDNAYASVIYHKIYDILATSHQLGASLCVEEISIILNKNPDLDSVTLTNALHSDRCYGSKEAAICTIAEKGFSQQGGTILMPDRNMNEFMQYPTITLEMLESLVGDSHAIASESGDLYLFDGQIGKDSVTNVSNGVPHISGDIPGQSARLVIMMRNKRKYDI